MDKPDKLAEMKIKADMTAWKAEIAGLHAERERRQALARGKAEIAERLALKAWKAALAEMDQTAKGKTRAANGLS